MNPTVSADALVRAALWLLALGLPLAMLLWMAAQYLALRALGRRLAALEARVAHAADDAPAEDVATHADVDPVPPAPPAPTAAVDNAAALDGATAAPRAPAAAPVNDTALDTPTAAPRAPAAAPVNDTALDTPTAAPVAPADGEAAP